MSTIEDKRAELAARANVAQMLEIVDTPAFKNAWDFLMDELDKMEDAALEVAVKGESGVSHAHATGFTRAFKKLKRLPYKTYDAARHGLVALDKEIRNAEAMEACK